MFLCLLFFAVSVLQDQDEDVLSFTQDGLCGRSLPVHGRVLPAADWMWHADQKPFTRRDSSGSSLQISLDMCNWMLHGVLPNPVWRLSHQETGECMETAAVYRYSHYELTVLYGKELCENSKMLLLCSIVGKKNDKLRMKCGWVNNDSTTFLVVSQVNYIVSDSEVHILNSWKQEDQNTQEVNAHLSLCMSISSTLLVPVLVLRVCVLCLSADGCLGSCWATKPSSGSWMLQRPAWAGGGCRITV